MPSLRSEADHGAVRAFLAGLEGDVQRAAPAAGAASGVLVGGPLTSDAWLHRRGPSPLRLIEGFRQAIYACGEINAAVLSAVPLRLYAAAGKGRARARAFAGPRPVGRVQRSYLAGLPYVARSLAAAEAVDEVTEHPWLDALADPNSEFDQASLLHWVVNCLDVVGTCYVRPDYAPGYPPDALWPLPPHEVIPERDGTSAIPRAYYHLGQRIAAEDLIRFRLPSLRDPYGAGYPPAQAAFAYAGVEEAWASTREYLLRNGPRPAVMVGPADAAQPFSPEQARRLKADVRGSLAGPMGGGVVVSEGAYDFKQIIHKLSDYSGDIGKEALQFIANCFGVPVAFLTSETNLANLQAAQVQHGRRAIGPRSQRIAAVLTKWVRRLDDRLFFAFDDCTPEDEEQRARVLDLYVKAGVITVDEYRSQIGWDPVPWGKEPWISNTLRQPSEERPAAPGPRGSAQASGEGEGEGEGDGPEPAPPAEPEGDGDDDAGEAAATKALLADAAAVMRAAMAAIERAAPEPDDDGTDDADHDEPEPDAQADDPAPDDAGGPDDGGDGGEPGGPGADDPAVDPARGAEHLRPADGVGGEEDPEAVVPNPGEGDPGDAADDRGPAAGGDPAAGELRRPDGGGDDADPGPVLGDERQEDDGPAGAGPGPLAGDGPPPENED